MRIYNLGICAAWKRGQISNSTFGQQLVQSIIAFVVDKCKFAVVVTRAGGK